MPTTEDFLRDAQHFEEWWQDEFSKNTPLESMSPAACVNTIFMHLSRFLRIKKGVMEFDKQKLMEKYLETAPPFTDDEAFRLVKASLDSRSLSAAENERLRQYTGKLRGQMNIYLGIRV